MHVRSGRWLVYVAVSLSGAFIATVTVGTACTPIFKRGSDVVPSPKLSEGMLKLMNDGWSPANRCGLSGYTFDLNGPVTALVSVGIVALFAIAGFRIVRRMMWKGRG
jgi:hypothetical protein